MKNTTVFKLVLLAIILGLLYLRYVYSPGPSSLLPLSSLAPSSSPSPSPISSTLQFSTPYFSLSYPEGATASANQAGPDSQGWYVAYLGETQRKTGRTQTELFDGYSLTLTRYEAVGDDLILTQSQADRQGIVEACGDEFASAVEPGNLAQRQTMTFTGGCLGHSTYHYFIQDDVLFSLSYMVVGDELVIPDYEQAVEAIIKSIVFI